MKQVRRIIATAAATSALAVSGALATAGTASAAPTAVTPAVYGCNYTDATPSLSLGSTGTAVKEAQCLLVYWGFSVGPSGVDGQFGKNTQSAVYGFQSWLHYACGLSVDGTVGPMTWHALKNPGC